MNECKIKTFFIDNEYLFYTGLFLAGCWVALFLINYFGNRIWAWVDDSDKVKQTHVIRYIMEMRGYKATGYKNGEIYRYKNSDNWHRSNGEEVVLIVFVLLLVAPFIIIKLYPVAMVVGLVFIGAHMGRFMRRHKKLFDAHVLDINAHKPEKKGEK